jgi:hypothetical protein
LPQSAGERAPSHHESWLARKLSGRGGARCSSPSGFEHSLTSHAASASARSSWEAVQIAARQTLVLAEGHL